jgi:hypothetical protein
MMQMKARNSRISRIKPLRPSLILENLEDRTLLSGGSGNVFADFLPAPKGIGTNGVLEIKSDSGMPTSNSSTAVDRISITKDATGQFIMVSGVTQLSSLGIFLTTINSGRSALFPMSSVTSIQVDLTSGPDSVTASGFSIPGDFIINLQNTNSGNTDTVTMTSVTANQILVNTNVLFMTSSLFGGGTCGTTMGMTVVPGGSDTDGTNNGINNDTGNNTISLTRVQTGKLFIQTGINELSNNGTPARGTDNISVAGVIAGAATFITGEGSDSVSINGLTTGNLNVWEGRAPQTSGSPTNLIVGTLGAPVVAGTTSVSVSGTVTTTVTMSFATTPGLALQDCAGATIGVTSLTGQLGCTQDNIGTGGTSNVFGHLYDGRVLNNNRTSTNNDPLISVINTKIAKADLEQWDIESGRTAATINVVNDLFTSNAANAAQGTQGITQPVGGVGGFNNNPINQVGQLTNLQTNNAAPRTLTIIANHGFSGTNNMESSPSGGSAYNVNVATDTFNTGSGSVVNNGSVLIQLGNARGRGVCTNISDSQATASILRVDTLSAGTGNFLTGTNVVNDLDIVAGNNVDDIQLSSLTVRELEAEICNNNGNFALINSTIEGTALLSWGFGAGTGSGGSAPGLAVNSSVAPGFGTGVVLDNVLLAVTQTDLALGRRADLNMYFLPTNGMVTLNNVSVGRNLNITEVDSFTGYGTPPTVINGVTITTTLAVATVGNTMWVLGQNFTKQTTQGVTVGQDMFLVSGNGNNTLIMNLVSVSNEMEVSLGTAPGSLFGVFAPGSPLSIPVVGVPTILPFDGGIRTGSIVPAPGGVTITTDPFTLVEDKAGTGVQTVAAQTVSALFGSIVANGGVFSPNNVYWNLDPIGNIGYNVLGFNSFIF